MPVALSTLLWTSAKPIIKFIVLGGCGAIMARHGILSPLGAKMIAGLILNYTLPALLFAKMLSCVSQDNIVELGYVAIIAVLYVLMGGFFGLIIQRTGRVPKRLFRGIVAASMFTNFGDLPISIILAVSDHPPFLVGDGALGTAYSSVFISVFYLFLFPLGGYRLIKYDHVKALRVQTENNNNAAAAAASMSQQQQQQPNNNNSYRNEIINNGSNVTLTNRNNNNDIPLTNLSSKSLGYYQNGSFCRQMQHNHGINGVCPNNNNNNNNNHDNHQHHRQSPPGGHFQVTSCASSEMSTAYDHQSSIQYYQAAQYQDQQQHQLQQQRCRQDTTGSRLPMTRQQTHPFPTTFQPYQQPSTTTVSGPNQNSGSGRQRVGTMATIASIRQEEFYSNLHHNLQQEDLGSTNMINNNNSSSRAVVMPVEYGGDASRFYQDQDHQQQQYQRHHRVSQGGNIMMDPRFSIDNSTVSSSHVTSQLSIGGDGQHGNGDDSEEDDSNLIQTDERSKTGRNPQESILSRHGSKNWAMEPHKPQQQQQPPQQRRSMMNRLMTRQSSLGNMCSIPLGSDGGAALAADISATGVIGNGTGSASYSSSSTSSSPLPHHSSSNISGSPTTTVTVSPTNSSNLAKSVTATSSTSTTATSTSSSATIVVPPEDNTPPPAYPPALQRSYNSKVKNKPIYIRIFNHTREYLTPPTIGLLLGLFVALIPPIRALFVVTAHPYGSPDNLPPLSFIHEITLMLGGCCVPLGLTVLGASLSRLKPSKWKPLIPCLTMLTISKLIISPIIGVALVQLVLVRQFGWVHLDAHMLQFTLMLMSGSPTSITCMVLAQVWDKRSHGAGAEMAAVIAVQYAAATLLLTFLSAGMMFFLFP